MGSFFSPFLCNKYLNDEKNEQIKNHLSKDQIDYRINMLNKE